MDVIQNPVRLAVPEDRAQLEALCRMLHQDNGIFSLSENKLTAVLDRYYNKEFAICGVIGPVGVPVASIYLAVDSTYYTDQWQLTELWNFVDPEHRRSSYATQLIDFAKHCADQMHLPMFIGILSNKRTEAKVRLYERKLEKAGAYFIYGREYAETPLAGAA